MARIIYGVSGQGFGHSTRSKEILTHLASKGHELLVFTYNQGAYFLKDDFNIWEVPGLELTYKNNKLVYWNTIVKNVGKLARQSKNWKENLSKFREFNPDLVITDFEPLSAVLAKVQRIPLISLDNQHQMTNTKLELPIKYKKDLMADQMVIKSLVWGAKYYLLTSFFKTEIKKKHTFLFPPILRKEIRELKTEKRDYILVYQTTAFGSLIEELKKIDQKFIVVGQEIAKIEGNVTLKKYSREEWLSDLANCKAIIGTAGLSLITESLYLEKPYLAIPINKQIEQVINAHYLRKMNYGDYCYKFNKECFEDFLKRLPEFEASLKNYPKSDNSEILKKLDELIDYLA